MSLSLLFLTRPSCPWNGHVSAVAVEYITEEACPISLHIWKRRNLIKVKAIRQQKQKSFQNHYTKFMYCPEVLLEHRKLFYGVLRLCSFSAVKNSCASASMVWKAFLNAFNHYISKAMRCVDQNMARSLPLCFIFRIDCQITSETRQVEMSASFSTTNQFIYQSVYFAILPLEEEITWNSDRNIMSVKFALELFKKSISNTIARIGYICSMNRAVSYKLKNTLLGLLGCGSHRFNLVVEKYFRKKKQKDFNSRSRGRDCKRLNFLLSSDTTSFYDQRFVKVQVRAVPLDCFDVAQNYAALLLTKPRLTLLAWMRLASGVLKNEWSS